MNKDQKIVDLTHTLSSEIPTWDGSCGFELEVTVDYKDCTAPDLFRIQKIKSNGGIGTHIDAPAHVIPGGQTIDQLAIESLVTDCVVIDVSAHADENYVIMPSDVENFEKINGKIAENSFVIFYTGWGARWDNKEKYHNDHKFPSIHQSTAELLLERGIVGLGTDTMSCDTGANGFPVHRVILGAGKYLVENIANANELPPTGSTVFVLPIKIKDGTEAPIRLIAIF